MPAHVRASFASKIQVAADFTLPELKYWAYDQCREHRFGWLNEEEILVTGKPKPGCQKCGIHFRKHQRIGIMWLYFKGRALLADSVGSGKSAHAAGLIAILKETGELTPTARVLICVRPAALMQWHNELKRMIPYLHIIAMAGTRKQRYEQYMEPWDVCLIGPQILINDEKVFDNFGLGLVVADDMDALRHPGTKTAYTLKRIGRRAPRMVIMTGTPLQKKLHEIHSVLDPIGGLEIFGSKTRFEKNYIITELVKKWVGHGINRRAFTTREIVGYRNTQEVSRLMAPLVLRRTAEDIDDVDLPEIMPPNNVFLELYPLQRKKYDEFRAGVLKIQKAGSVSRVKATGSLHIGAQICGGLSLVGEEDGLNTSSKMDWVMEQLTGDLSDEKVVVFCYYKGAIRSLSKRLDAANIGHGIIWGEEPDKDVREATRARFWNDENCRVLLGTSAIEQSLNLQCARHIICFDSILNPARMLQIVGRIRRDGSKFKHIFVHNLFTLNTQEERYLSLLENEMALLDAIWAEDTPLYASLDPIKLLRLITS